MTLFVEMKVPHLKNEFKLIHIKCVQYKYYTIFLKVVCKRKAFEVFWWFVFKLYKVLGPRQVMQLRKWLENEQLRNKWGSTSCNVLGVRPTRRVFNMACASAIAYLFPPGQFLHKGTLSPNYFHRDLPFLKDLRNYLAWKIELTWR